MPSTPHSALFAAVYRHPGDLDVRRVLADALLEEGDLRGELLVLQLARAVRPESKPTRRELTLLRAHGPKWLGRLSKYLEKPTFEAGFVTAATTRAAAFRPADAAWPEWSTVRELSVGNGSRVPMLALAKLHSLEVLRRITLGDLRDLVSRNARLPYRRIGIRAGYPSPVEVDPLNGLVELQAGLPKLTSLEVVYARSSMGSVFPYFSDLEDFFGSKLFKQLRTLSFGLEGLDDVNALLERVAHSKLQMLVCAVDNDGTVVNVDMRAKRIDVPNDLAGVIAPKGFELAVGGLSKTAQKAARYWEKVAKERPELLNYVPDEDDLWLAENFDELAARGFITPKEAERRKTQRS